MPAIRRTLKNVVKNYSDAQVKVREATSNDPWGPSSTLMSEIADLTYNVMAFTEIMQMVWKRLNDDGKNWRHVYKSLVVLDYIIKTGSEKVAQQCKENFHAIKTLTSFQYIDADNKDQGMNVREKAKHLVTMLSDDERLKNERAKALKAKERFAQNAMGVGSSGAKPQKMRLGGSPDMGGGYPESLGYTTSASSPGSLSAGTPSEIESARPSSAGEEELQLQLALAMSKEDHDEHQRKNKADDIKLQMALEESRAQPHQATTQRQNSTLLDIAGSSSSGAAASDPWGLPMPSSQPPTDPWGAPTKPAPAAPVSAAPPDPWGASGGHQPPATHSVIQSSPQQPVDPWGMPVAAPAAASPLSAGAWSNSASPVPQPSAWDASPSSHTHTSPGAALDPFGAPVTSNGTNGTNGTSTLDDEFDILSSRSNDPSPTKPGGGQGLEEFDLLSGGSSNAFDMGGLGQSLEDKNKPKSAQDFLGANASLVNLDQLVSKAPPKGNNPFAMTSGQNNPFQDPNARPLPMAQMQQQQPQLTGFSQPQPTQSGGLLPAPLLPLGQPQPQPMQPQHQPQQSYNPFL